MTGVTGVVSGFLNGLSKFVHSKELDKIEKVLRELAKELKDKNDDRYHQVAKASGVIKSINKLVTIYDMVFAAKRGK